MKTTIPVKLQTGFFERTDFKWKITANGLTFKPAAKGGETISIPAAGIKTITFYETKLRIEIQSDMLTDVYLTNESDWLDAMKALKEKIGVKITCEIN